ncbi:MAG: NAD(P)-binding domain-containing protein, partial [Deltaproteobacteria bacterium]|nr:NAD(P)-binding domain-containing protein [Deltaproteobacteria bacterium]
LLELWTSVIKKTGLKINTVEKMSGMTQENGFFKVTTTKGEYLTKTVVLAIGRRGTPRKLGVPGENIPKVYYRLLEPEQHHNQDLLVVGGGDSAIEAAIALTDQPNNRVILSYRGESFSRIKPKNSERLEGILSRKTPSLKVIFNSTVKEIGEKDLKLMTGTELTTVPNDYVYVFAGGELPTEFLKNIGVQIEKKFGKA